MNQPELNLFERSAIEDKTKYWLIDDVMKMYDYKSKASFMKVVNKSIAVCASLDLNIMDSFVQDPSVPGGYKFTRFACYLLAMSADEKKENVKEARVYLAAFASSVQDSYDASDDLARIELRDELKTSEKILSSRAQDAGLQSHQFGVFKDAGYRGMYNMSLNHLKTRKGFVKGTLYDFMSQTELAGNFFRVTQTSEKIVAYKLKGLTQLEDTARAVGSEIRQMMIKNSGLKPEDIPLTENVSFAKNRLKATNKKMIKADS